MWAPATELTPLTSKPKRRPFLVLDIESKDGDSQRAGFTRPFLVGVYEGSQFYPFADRDRDGDWRERYFWEGGCVDKAMRFILRKKFRGHHIYAHNAGRFDYLFLLPWLMNEGTRLGYRFSVIPVSSSIQVLDVWKGRRRNNIWRFVDSFKLIPTSLDKAAKTFGLAGKLKHDLNLPETDRRWYAYLEQDCVELYNVLTKFHGYVENVLLGEVGITAPATAMKIFRRNYLGRSVPRSEGTHEFVRRGYFGGRVEAYEKKARGLRYLDINSSYPAAMLSDMPVGEAAIWDGEPPTRFREERIGFVEADVHLPDMHIPPLPVRDADSGKLLFPVGNLSGVWEWEELQLALELGATIKQWKKSVWYAGEPFFEEFVRNLYKYRDKNHEDYDEGLAAVVKIMLNATYGKFGMRTKRRKIYLYDDPRMPDDAVPVTNDPESLVWVAEEDADAPYVMPQVAARVTALARIRLFRSMKAALDMGALVAYTDTDSIITTADLPTSTELGALKDELPDYAGRLVGHFIGPKTYILTVEEPDFEAFTWERDHFERVKAKGLERRTREVVERLASGKTIYQQRLEKVGSLARAQFKRGPRMLTVPRRILKTEGKRRVNADGSTSPYRMEMW